MKTFFKYSLALIIFTSLFIVGCKEDEGDCLPGAEMTISNISPNQQIQTGEVSISGQNLNFVDHIFVGQIEAEISNQSDGSLTFTVPLNAKLGENELTLASGCNNRTTDLINVDILPSPIISSITPWAPIGGEMVITGSSLENNPTVTIDGVEASIVSTDGFTMVVTVPAGIPDNDYLDVVVSNEFGSFESPIPLFARENHIQNGDLSEGSGNEFTGWEKLNGGDQMTEVVGEDALGGGRSMRVVGAAANPWNTQLASAPMQLEFGEEYTILFAAKAEEPGAVMRVSQSQFDGNGADYFYSNDVELTTNWAFYAFPLTVTVDLAEHKTLFDMGATNVPFLIDHMALVRGNVGDVGGGAPNLINNGSFEDGLSGWESLNGTHEISADAVCGSSSLTASGAGGNPWDVQIASDPLDMSAGNDYEISFWAKAAGPDGIFRISMSQYNGGDGSDFFYSDDLEIPEDWAYYSFVLQDVPAVASGEYKLLFDMGASTQTFFVDAVSVKEYEYSPGIIPNGEFEDLSGWTSLNGTHEISSDAFSGSGSMTTTGAGGNPWDAQMASDHMPDIVAGNDYKVSFWAKAAGPDGIFRISMSQYNGGDGSDFFYSDDLEIPEDWTHFSFILEDVPAVASGEYKLLFDQGASTQTFFVDNVSILEYEICE